MQGYNPKIVDHFMNPRNVGEIVDADGVGTVGHPSCGDIVRIYIKVSKKEGELSIVQAKFKTFGCTTAIATSSIATEMIQGKTLRSALNIRKADVADALGGLPPIKMHCSVLAEDAIKAALANYFQRTGHSIESAALLHEGMEHEDQELLKRNKI